MTPSIKVPWLPYGWDGLAMRWVILYRSSNPSESLRRHEMVHIEQQKHYGYLTYLYRYITSSDFRYEMEREAYEKGTGLDFHQAHLMALRYKNY